MQFISCPRHHLIMRNIVLLLPGIFSCVAESFFGQEIFSLDKFWFCELTQNTLKPIVWHLLHQNILIVNDFMKVYEKSITFITSLIFNIFWWKKCQTIGLKVFWNDPWNQNLSKFNISCPKYFSQRWNINQNMSQTNLWFYDTVSFINAFLFRISRIIQLRS